MPLTPEGLTIKRLPQILEELNTELKANLGQNIDTSENSIAGAFNAIYAKSLADLWELAQGVYDSTDLLKAEGEALDNLGLIVGFLRSPATPTAGVAYFTGNDGTTIPEGSLMQSIRRDPYETTEEVSITATDSVNVRLTVALARNNETYTVTIDTTTYTYVSDANATITEILTGLHTEMLINTDVALTLFIDPDVEEDSYIEIDKNVKDVTMSVTAVSYITFPRVTTPSVIRSVEAGKIIGDAETITTIVDAVVGWDSVTNPTDLKLGTDLATDEEFRNTILTGFNTVGNSTPDTIGSRLLEVNNVTDVKIRENVTEVTDGNGLPPKSYECIVNGGDSQEIGDEIWRTKPAGIRTFGTVSVDVLDFNSQEHTVHFSRPITKYAHISVYYTKYAEEIFPSDGEDLMKQVMLEYGDSLTIDEDIIPQRFVGDIYRDISGIEGLDIKIALTANVDDDPNVSPLVPFTSDPIPISDEEISSFATIRMEVTEGTRP